MEKPAAHSVNKAVDSIQEHLTDYACGLQDEDLSPEAIHAAKVRIIDVLGALTAGFFGEPCRIARELAAQMPDLDGSTVLGTRMKASPDLAAFVNATTSRYPELTDSYHWPGTSHGHASDTVTPVLAAGEHAQVSGRDFITGVVLSYEVFLRMSDVHIDPNFDNTNLTCLGSAVGAAKLWGLSREQISHCISMAVVPNVILKQVRSGQVTMFKAVAAGHAGRAGVFAAMLAREGMEGPHLPYEGKAGWCEHVAKKRFKLGAMGGKGTRFKILDTQLKMRPSEGSAIPPILAAEKIAPLRNLKDVKEVTVEVYKYAVDAIGSDEHQWHPDTREAADHSLPYNIAAALMDGTVTLRTFNEAHLANPELRALMQKIKVVENQEFTKAFDRVPVEHHARITVVTADGKKLVGETGGDQDDMAAPKTDAQVVEKFRGLTEDYLGSKRVSAILDRLWSLEELGNVAEIPPALVLV